MKKSLILTGASIAVATLFLLIWQPAISQIRATDQSGFSESADAEGLFMSGQIKNEWGADVCRS